MNVPPPPPPPLTGANAPLAAPKPHRVDQDMARNLENLGGYANTPPPLPNPPQLQVNYTPGFHSPPPNSYNAGYQSRPPPPPQGPNSYNTYQSPPPPPPQGPNPYGPGPGAWSPWGGLQAPGPQGSLPPGAMPPRSYSASPQPGYHSGPPQPPPLNHTSSAPALHQDAYNSAPSLAQSMSSLSLGNIGSNSPPPGASTSLTADLPLIPTLLSILPTIRSAPPTTQIQWCRDVLLLVDKAAATSAALASTYPNSASSSSTDPPSGPVVLDDQQLAQLAQIAVPLALQIAGQAPTSGSMNGIQAYVAEALYHRACLTASGAFPEHVKQNPRQAFRDFEGAARGGYARAWFRIGRDYEAFGDVVHAKECFERGAKNGVAACMYRLGMAHLLGQLNLPVSPEIALPLLKRAAVASHLDSPQPGYVYALLLLGEFTQYTVPPHLWNQLQLLPPHLAHLPGNQGVQGEAKTHLERSAHLHFAPAQYKLGHAYEFAVPPWEFDALLSVEWYSRASQQGEVEADMALSKWFLCGSGDVAGPNGFDKDESLARVFAEKAARRGLPSAEFGLAYYFEVGVGGEKNLNESIAWYAKAASHGNTDAADRLAALQQPSPQSLSRAEHDNITENKLVRTRTQAKLRSEAQKVRDGYLEKQEPPQMYQASSYGGPPPGHPGPQQPYRRDSKQVVELIRKNTLGSSGSSDAPGGPGRHHGRYTTEPKPGGPPHPTPQGSLPPQGYGNPGPQLGLPKQYPNANRYTLVDHGSGSPKPSTSPHGSPGLGHPGRVPSAGPPGSSHGPGNRPGSSGGPAGGTPKPRPSGPQTFAEMGIQSGKADEKDCVVM
ncbi:hypothetical protein E1B28_011510 [Marasmius oreades]|uniref:HCP-like protein n=1 Tax=Marasmius oreades TaxID=181124 RepID=A0A9P7UQ20_9AGAR|nr:uncharacterized protein E1B28_011510 [Marasmius oreades]KAG7089868.1 hypothetical protein E1B28_011510 [Marasmius oreades]